MTIISDCNHEHTITAYAGRHSFDGCEPDIDDREIVICRDCGAVISEPQSEPIDLIF